MWNKADREKKKRIEWFRRKKNKGERRGEENIYKRNIGTIKFIWCTRKMAKSHQLQAF
jgi:hypothetical protein